MRKGEKMSEETKQKLRDKMKGREPWCKGTKGLMPSNKTSFKKGHIGFKNGDKIKATVEKNGGVWNKGLKGFMKPNKGSFKKNDIRISGKNSNSWKGGITTENEKIRKSDEYKKWRISVFVRDDYTCIFCKKRGLELNADHIKPFSSYPELRLDINNGRTLCVDCHKKTDTYLKPNKRWT